MIKELSQRQQETKGPTNDVPIGIGTKEPFESGETKNLKGSSLVIYTKFKFWLREVHATKKSVTNTSFDTSVVCA